MLKKLTEKQGKKSLATHRKLSGLLRTAGRYANYPPAVLLLRREQLSVGFVKHFNHLVFQRKPLFQSFAQVGQVGL